MKYLAALFVAGAAASNMGSPVKRDLAAVTSALSAVQSGTEAVTEDVSNFQGVNDAIPLQEASSSLVDTIREQTEAVAALPELSTQDSLTLPVPIQDLGRAVNSSVDALIEKKPAFDEAGLTSIVQMQLEDLSGVSGNFSDTLLSKTPEALRGIGSNLAGPIAAALQRAVDAYGAGGGDNSTSGGSGGSSEEPSSTGGAAGEASSTAVPDSAARAAAGYGVAALAVMAAFVL